MKMSRRDFSTRVLGAPALARGLAGLAGGLAATGIASAQSSKKASPTGDAPKPSFKPVGVGTNAAKSGYWIMRCEKEIIAGHNDVWSQQAMETYVALVRETEFLRTQKPAPRK